MTIKQWHVRISEWVVKNLFPIAPVGEPISHVFLRKADEELAEFKAEILKLHPSPTAIAMEAADVCNTILAAAGAHCDSALIQAAVVSKMGVLESGDWYYNTELRVFKRRK